ncbi:MAG: hypothetical protein HGA31_05205 [Candidatus Moranbacteria bacterium]|nr:hypothetical protein [Candidatus Moranbacteria bacterium]
MKRNEKTDGKPSSLEPVNGAHAIKQRLRREGKVETLNRPEDIARMLEMNKRLMEARRDFQGKQFRSRRRANEVILD